jgi:hypothetical protein
MPSILSLFLVGVKMIDKQALSMRLSGLSEVFKDCGIKEDLQAMSHVIANMSPDRYEDLIDKEAFRLPGMDKIKGIFQKPGDQKMTGTPQQKAQSLKDKYQEAGPSGKLLTMFDHSDVQNAYKSLPGFAKKLVDRYISKWKMGDLVGKSAAEEKEALFEDKSPIGAYKALNKAISNFSSTYDVSLLPKSVLEKFNDLSSTIKTVEDSPETLSKGITPEEQAMSDSGKKSPTVSEEDVTNDKNINNFLKVMDKHFKADLQKDLTPALKNEYTKMTGDIVGQLKGDIEQGFRDSSPDATYPKKSPYAPKAPVAPKAPKAPVAPAAKAPVAPAAKAPVAPAAKAPVAPAAKAPVAPAAKAPVAPAAKAPAAKAPAAKAPVAPAAKAPAAKAPVAPAAKAPAAKAPVAPAAKSKSKLDVDSLSELLKGEGTKGKVKVPKSAFDSNVITSEGVSMSPTMVEIDQDSDEIRKLSKILAHNEI